MSAAPPTLTIPLHAVFSITLSACMSDDYTYGVRQLYQQVQYKRNILLPDLLRRPRPEPPPPLPLFEQDADPQPSFPALHLCLAAFLTGKKNFECAHWLIERVIAPAILREKEVLVSSVMVLVRQSAAAAGYLFQLCAPIKEQLLHFVYGCSRVPPVVAFEQLEQSFASLANILSPPSATPTSVLLFLGGQFLESRGSGFYLGNAWKMLSLEEERQLLTWIVQLVFRTIQKETFAEQLNLIYRYFGILGITAAPGMCVKLMPAFISLLHTLHARLLYSRELNMFHSSTQPVVRMTINNLNILYNADGATLQEEAPGDADADAFAARDRRQWSAFLKYKWWVFLEVNDDDDDEASSVSREPEQELLAESSLDERATEMYLFTQNEADNTISVSVPYVLRRRSEPHLSPFEFVTLQGTTHEHHTLTFLTDHTVRLSLATDAFMDLFRRVLIPLRWARHATQRLFHMLTNPTKWWQIGTPTVSIDNLIDIWSRWFRACAYNLKTLSSEKLTEAQLKLLRCPYLSSEQKKRMAMAMITAMEYHTLFLFDPIEMYRFKHLLTLLLTSVSLAEVPLIRMFFAMLVERFVQLISLDLYEEMDPDSVCPALHSAAYMQSLRAGWENPAVAESFPALSDKVRRLVRSVEVPDWRESCYPSAELERIHARSLDSEPAAAHDSISLQRVRSFLQKHKPLQHEDEADIHEAETLLFRFLVGLCNSTFMRALVEIPKYQLISGGSGILFFLKWQPALFAFQRPFQMDWMLRRCESAFSRYEFVRPFYALVETAFRWSYWTGDSVYSQWKRILRCKNREAQLRALTGFADAFPSFMELHLVQEESRLNRLFPNRAIVYDCSICFESIDVRKKSVGLLTACGHFFCVPCAFQALFDREDNPEMGVSVQWKMREQTLCPYCRTSVNVPQPELPTCFGKFTLPETATRWEQWSVPRFLCRAFVLPCLFVVDFAEEQRQRQRQQRVTRKRAREEQRQRQRQQRVTRKRAREE